tara:strand:- start:85907 stop:86062 length:156 start_codon:yes stop_codon:yes gene_type:complete
MKKNKVKNIKKFFISESKVNVIVCLIVIAVLIVPLHILGLKLLGYLFGDIP